MARRRQKHYSRTITPDPVYENVTVAKFVNSMSWDGKKSKSYYIFYTAMNIIKEKTGTEGIEVFEKAIETIKPLVEVKSKRLGGTTYQVPVEVYPFRKQSLAIRWIVKYARQRNGKSMAQKLANELLDASQSLGGAFKKKEEVRKMAEANRAFAHYAW